MNNYNVKTGELKNVEKLVEQTVQALKSSWNGLKMWIFVQPVKGRKSYVVSAIFCINPRTSLYINKYIHKSLRFGINSCRFFD